MAQLTNDGVCCAMLLEADPADDEAPADEAAADAILFRCSRMETLPSRSTELVSLPVLLPGQFATRKGVREVT